MKRARVGTLGLLLAAGCGRSVGVSGTEEASTPPRVELGERTVETFADPLEIIAGTEVTATCVVSRQREYLPGAPTNLNVSPDAGGVNGGGSTFTFTPTVAGTYSVNCESEGILDTGGVTLEVLPAAPAVVETALEFTSAQAGAPTGVTCTVFDGFANIIEAAPGVDLEVDPELRVDPPVGESFTVRGTVAGDYNVACKVDTLVDPSPELLTITPGLPGIGETSVSATNLLPEESTDVTCSFTDNYGNPVTVMDDYFLVLADDGTPNMAAGVVETPSGFSATKAGVYYVFCAATGFRAADESPAVVTVHPGLPHHWMAELPSQNCFWQDRGLPLFYEVFDRWDNVIDPMDYTLTVSSVPMGASLDAEGIVRVVGEGDFDITVDVTSMQDPMSTIMAFQASVRIDSTPPAFTSVTPARSAMLSQGGLANDNVAISGDVSDAVSFITEVQVLGAIKSVSGSSLMESFTHTQSSRWGLNIITGEATDECGNRRVTAQSYLRGRATGGYYPANTSMSGASAADRGIIAHLNQEALDDGDRNDVDDLLTIIQLILDGLDWNTLVGVGQEFDSDPLRSSSDCSGCFDAWADYSYWVGRDTRSSEQILGNIVFNFLNARAGGMDFDVDINGLSFPVEFDACARECLRALCVGGTNTDCVSGTLRVNGSVDANGFLGISQMGSSAMVTAGPPFSVTVSGLNISNLSLSCPGLLSLFCGLLEGLIEDAINLALGAFRSQLDMLITNQLASILPGFAGDFLNSFELDTAISLPPPFSMTMNLNSGLDRVLFGGSVPNGYGQLGLFTQVFPGAKGADVTTPTGRTLSIPSSAGALRKDNSGSGCCLPTFASSPGFALGLKDDMINQLLWTMWYGGALQLDLAALTGLGGSFDLTGIDVQMFATLPPVVMTGTGGNMVDIGLGDMYVEAEVDLAALLGSQASGAPPLTVGMYLSTILGGYIDIDNGPPTELVICLPGSTDSRCPMGLPDPVVYVEVVEIDDEGYQGLMTDLFSQLFRLVLPQLLTSAVGSFPIPEFDLGSIAMLPSGAPIVLRIGNASLDRPNVQYIRLSGDLQ